MSRTEPALRIGIIAHIKHAIREPFAGGLEWHTAHLTQALIKKGHTVKLFCAGDDVSRPPHKFFCQPTAKLAATTDGGFACEHHAYHDLMRAITVQDFDIIHNNSLHYLPLAMADLLSMPMVTTLHTPPFWEMAGSIRLSSHENRVFVAVSESIRKSWSAVTDVDYVIPNGIDLKKFVHRPSPMDDAYLFWFGRIVPEKGLHLAIEAAQLAKIPLRFAGPVADREYFDACIQPNIGGPVEYLGHLSHDCLTALLGGARACLCTPIWEEPYGLVVAEALACGTPVVGFARGALPDLIDAKSGILVEPRNVQALAAAAHAAQSLSRSDCRRRATEIGDAARMIQAYEDLYHSLCGTARPRICQPARSDWYRDLSNSALLRSYYLQHMPADFAEFALLD